MVQTPKKKISFGVVICQYREIGAVDILEVEMLYIIANIFFLLPATLTDSKH